MWFPRELNWKKAPKDNTKVWILLKYLGCSFHTQDSQEKTAGNKRRMRHRQQQRTFSSSSGPSEWQLQRKLDPREATPSFLCISLPRVKETHSSPSRPSPYRGPGSSSGDLTPEQTRVEKIPSPRPGTCVSAWSYATLTEFHFLWQVERGDSQQLRKKGSQPRRV